MVHQQKRFLKAMPKVLLFCVFVTIHFICSSCSDFLRPVESEGDPTEYSFNYWLLQSTYLYTEELSKLPEDGDSAQALYRLLEDPYTRYIPPSKSQAATISLNTTFVPGDVGMEYVTISDYNYPICIYRVYPKGPAGRAGIKRGSFIKAINGVDLQGNNALGNYHSILDTCATVKLLISRNSKDSIYELTKEDVYAPTIFIDTIYDHIFITITEFKLNTSDTANGSFGELKTYLDSTQNEKSVRIIDIRDNPGGHLSQCIPMADLFVKSGTLSSRYWRTFNANGESIYRNQREPAHKGDPGENGKFIILANNNSASCAEIFAAAVTELEDIPMVGSTTYGKGIGQTNWKTYDNGLAIITNLEFLTPNGNSYHKKGLVPKYDCPPSSILKCATEVADKHFGYSPLKNSLYKDSYIFENYPLKNKKNSSGGAILPSLYLEQAYYE